MNFGMHASLWIMVFSGCMCREFYSMSCGNLNRKELQEREDICLCVAESLCCIAETNTLCNNHIPIKQIKCNLGRWRKRNWLVSTEQVPRSLWWGSFEAKISPQWGCERGGWTWGGVREGIWACIVCGEQGKMPNREPRKITGRAS